ncbi:hypothetical protein B0T16DRAFT_421397 [Cercophora newfieldiana]|uniref:Secreted protein n=1 Tax=Cercophora newfieldiana TaxID=92897 RepID=A0AA39XQZ2_9PEZI|nr:hypothetical protein B0T16DRAFT_421397 [Cercophora newfieldiana]
MPWLWVVLRAAAGAMARELKCRGRVRERGARIGDGGEHAVGIRRLGAEYQAPVAAQLRRSRGETECWSSEMRQSCREFGPSKPCVCSQLLAEMDLCVDGSHRTTC